MIYFNLFLTIIFFFALFSVTRTVYLYYLKLNKLKEIEENESEYEEYNEEEVIEKINFKMSKSELIFNGISLSYVITFIIGIFIL